MEKEKYEIVKFVDNGFELEVNVSPEEDTVWLNAEEMAILFKEILYFAKTWNHVGEDKAFVK